MFMIKSHLILNPVAGIDSAPNYVEIIKEHLSGTFGEIDAFLTEKAGDARDLAAEAVKAGCTNVFIAGGDGTLNEVLNGVAATENGFEQITFGLIPLGTGNDFAKAALNLPENVEETLVILARDEAIKVDVGKLSEESTHKSKSHFFVNVSAGGFIAEVSDAINPQLKSIAGKLAYLIGGAQVLFDFEPFKTLLKVRYASGEIVTRQYDLEMFAVCNSKMLGGGRLIAPDAEINDGLFDVCVFTATETTLEFINVLTQIAAGAHLGEESVEYFRTQFVEFEFEREIKVNADGEVLLVKKASYEILPRAAKFLTNQFEYVNE